METITITIPKKVFSGHQNTRLVVVDPKKFERELRRRWEIEDAKGAIREARLAWRGGRARLVSDLGEIIKT